VGCHARIGLTQGDVDAFKAGSAASVTINPLVAPETDVAIPVSLSGFTAAFKALTEN
jgi:invasion protein IalB